MAGDIGGVQAQVMSGAEMQIGVRVDCTAANVRDALWKDKRLVKTWLMRGTLHLLPAQDLPLYTAAMRTRWTRVNKTWLKYVGLTMLDLLKLVDDIGDSLDGGPMTREELFRSVGKGHSERVREVLKSGWGMILKPVARNGLLCFGPSRGQAVTFVRPQQWLGTWRDLDPDVALVEVARRYLRVFGPATKIDFARWWGNWPGVGNAAWEGLTGELAPVSVEGKRADILTADLDRISRVPTGSWVQMLPTFDPYLLGHASRDHLVEAAYRSRVSRAAGWISAVVLVDGRVAGTWTHTAVKQTLRVTVDPFKRLSARTVAEVRARCAAIAEFLGLAKAEVVISR